MRPDIFLELLKIHKENSLYDRYINNDHITPLLNHLSSKFVIDHIGNSVNKESIHSITIGNGSKKILMWSQMHGNESTTTKALFDIINALSQKNMFSEILDEHCTLKIIPILNPDGARVYTRVNANNIDLNRDAQNQSQPESQTLLKVFNEFKPDFCFNLHGQRTIFSAGNASYPATVSFLAPAQDVMTTVTQNRKRAMEVIVKMNSCLQQLIPSQVGIYDDNFNLDCVGDSFQSENVPTILFEAGHYENDYQREKVRTYIGIALMTSTFYIAKTEITGDLYGDYFKIPMNKRLFFDIIIRNAKLKKGGDDLDIAIQFQEILRDGKIKFEPIIDTIGNLASNFGHLEINVNSKVVQGDNNTILYEGYENDFVMINNELFALNSINS